MRLVGSKSNELPLVEM